MRFFGSNKELKILFVAAEAAPFIEVGGLASVMHSLPKSLRRLGHDVRVMIPRYLAIPTGMYPMTMEKEGLKVPTDNDGDQPTHLICNVKKYDSALNPRGPVTAYFLENQEYYEHRANVYGYGDDPIRWALLSRGVLEFLKVSNWVPDVIVACDWTIGYLPNYLKTAYRDDRRLSKITTLFSIHNLFHQGMFDHRFVNEMDFDDGHFPIPGFNNPRLLKINGMRRGIMYADVINTVSPNYSREIMTEEYGELLHDLLRERRAVLYGILNGIDHELWNPQTDPAINCPFSVSSLDRRLKNKTVLQSRFGLPIDKQAFIVSVVARLTRQKGFDLLYTILETLIQELPMQLVVVGEGEADLMGFFHNLETKYPKKVSAHLKFDSVLPHIVYAGSSVTLIPSRFEPCGLTQIEAMRYGTIPIVRKTGGLADTVEDYNPEQQSGTGFVFEKFDSSSLMIALIRAFENFRNKKSWEELQKRAMTKDFSWDRSAQKYAEVFARAVELHFRSKQIGQ